MRFCTEKRYLYEFVQTLTVQATLGGLQDAVSEFATSEALIADYA